VRVDLVMLDRIVREQLNMPKISACWMPRIFTRKIKKTGSSVWRKIWSRCRQRGVSLGCGCLLDEIHQFNLETKEQSKHWKHIEAQEVQSSPQCQHEYVHNFCSAEGVDLIDCIPSKVTITRAYYGDLLRWLCDSV